MLTTVNDCLELKNDCNHSTQVTSTGLGCVMLKSQIEINQLAVTGI
jgi:hypothetical protein